MAEQWITLGLTSPLTHGHGVAEAQYLLTKNRWLTNFHPGVMDGYYGPLTAHASLRAKYWLGYPTGGSNYNMFFGYQLRSYLVPREHPAYQPLPLTYKVRRRARIAAVNSWQGIDSNSYKIAATQLGYNGTGNAGICSKYGQWYGMTCANWCAMFVSWCRAKAGSHFRYSYVPNIVADALNGRNGLALTSSPRRGTLVCWDWTGDGVWDHVEQFDEWASSDEMWTIGGNTGTTNGVPGGEVVHELRSTGIRHRFVEVHG